VKTIRWPLSFFFFAVLLFFPSRILQFISLLSLAVFGVSFAYSRLMSAAVVIRRRNVVIRAHRFEPMEIVLTIENRSPFPLAGVTVIDTIGPLFSREPGKSVVRLRPWERKRISYAIESQHRGEYSLGPAVLLCTDPLGLFPWRRKFTEVERLVVYPEVLPLCQQLESGLPAGNVRTWDRLYEDVTRYRSLREYVPGDDARKISWKVSARMGNLYSMEYLPHLFAPVLILMNMNGEDYPFRFRFLWVERATVMAASLVMHFFSLGQEIGLIASASLNGAEALTVARISGAPGHAAGILEMLARMDVSREQADFTRLLYAAGVDIPIRTRIEVVTPTLGEEQRVLLLRAKEKGCPVELFLVGGDSLGQREQLSKEFSVFVVSDFGNELIRR
jgi:uncharacterized protein (DUF58 family)